MIECGIKPKDFTHRNINLQGLDSCLCTHGHLDHCRSTKYLMSRAVDCYMTQGTADMLKVSGHRLHIIEPLKQFSIGPWAVLPFPTEHDTPGSAGFLIQNAGDKLLFLTDTMFCRYKFSGINILAIECNWNESTLAPDLDPAVKKRLYNSHMSLGRVLKFIEANDMSVVREIHLLHLSDGNSDAKMFKDTVCRSTGIPTYIANK